MSRPRLAQCGQVAEAIQDGRWADLHDITKHLLVGLPLQPAHIVVMMRRLQTLSPIMLTVRCGASALR